MAQGYSSDTAALAPPPLRSIKRRAPPPLRSPDARAAGFRVDAAPPSPEPRRLKDTSGNWASVPSKSSAVAGPAGELELELKDPTAGSCRRLDLVSWSRTDLMRSFGCG